MNCIRIGFVWECSIFVCIQKLQNELHFLLFFFRFFVYLLPIMMNVSIPQAVRRPSTGRLCSGSEDISDDVDTDICVWCVPLLLVVVVDSLVVFSSSGMLWPKLSCPWKWKNQNWKWRENQSFLYLILIQSIDQLLLVMRAKTAVVVHMWWDHKAYDSAADHPHSIYSNTYTNVIESSHVCVTLYVVSPFKTLWYMWRFG